MPKSLEEKKRALQVCLIAPFPPPYGGIANWTFNLLRFSKDHADAHLTLLDIAPRWRSIHQLGVVRRILGGGAQLLRDACRLMRLLYSRKFDVLHLTTSGGLASGRDVACLFISKLFDVEIVYHIRFGRIPEIIERNTIEWRLIKRVIAGAGKVVVIDEATFLAVKSALPFAKITKIPNFVDFSTIPLVKPLAGVGRKTAVFLGWVTRSKGIADLLEAWEIAADSSWNLDIIGPKDSEFANEMENKYGNEKIRFLGELARVDALAHMASCDLFVFPSHTEGFPNAVAEAMSLGLPIVATRVGAIPEMLGNGAGFLVDQKRKDQLAKILKEVLQNTELRKSAGRLAFERVRRLYDVEVIFSRYLEEWRAVSR